MGWLAQAVLGSRSLRPPPIRRSSSRQQRFAAMGWGGGKGKGGGGYVWMPMFDAKGWGKGKGMSAKNFRPDKKVWIGGIAEGVTYKELHEHMKPSGAKWVEVFKGSGKGAGVACYATSEEATAAIAALNGSTVGGGNLQVDAWEKKAKEA
mmetsp:Transcript_59184/g.150308  ORF Transcript_59184/g.150308 Transcript_59184/m.150308 type:complete len:150 (+) Transcript_59184:3-452(+)